MYLHVATKKIDVIGLKNSPKITTGNTLADKILRLTPQKKNRWFSKTALRKVFFWRESQGQMMHTFIYFC